MRDLKEETHGGGQTDPLVTGKSKNLDRGGEKREVLWSCSTFFKYTVTEAEYLTAMDKHILYVQISVWTLHYSMLTLRHFHNKIQL